MKEYSKGRWSNESLWKHFVLVKSDTLLGKSFIDRVKIRDNAFHHSQMKVSRHRMDV